MKITVCIGSACHLKGARQVVEELQYLVAKNDLKESINLGGTFCMGTCTEDVSVTVEGKNFSVKPEDVKTFFETEILPNVK